MIMARIILKSLWRHLFLLIVGTLFFTQAQGQDNYILYGFRDIQQGNYLNPAFSSNSKIVVGFPGLSNIDVGYLNTAGSFNDFFKTQNGSDSLYLDLSKVINQNHPVDHINLSINQDLVYVGFMVKQSFLSFGVKQRLLFRTFIPGDLFKLAWNGNAPYVGQTLDLRPTIVNEDHFFDYHVGLSVPVSKGLRLGVRLHLLQGLSNIHVVNNQLQLITSSDPQNVYDILASTSFVLNTAGLPDSSGFNPGAYLGNFKNIGFSIDLGIDYQINDQFSVSASLLDLGSTNFREKTKSYQSQEANIHFNGTQVDFINNKDPFSSIGDSLSNLLHVTDLVQNYRAKIPKHLLIAGEYYSKDRKNRASILFSGRFYQDYFEPAVSLGFDRSLSEYLSVKVNYTYIKYAPLNLGLAFALNLTPVQLYMYTDNILGVQWDSQRMLSFGFGINIRIPKQTKAFQKPNQNNDLIPELISPLKR